AAAWLPAGQSASASSPDSLRSPSGVSTTRSLGHLRRATTPATSSTASAIARPAAKPTAPATRAGGRSSTETSSEPPGGATQVRDRRPRPAVWWSATTTVPSRAPSRARSMASAFVDPVVATQRTSANRPPASADRARSPATTWTGTPAGLAPPSGMPVNIWRALQDPDRQPGGDRGPRDPGLPGPRHHLGRRLLRPRPRQPARPPGGRGLRPRWSDGGGELPRHREDPRRHRAVGSRRGAPGLRVLQREHRL